jgi:hypothetical protein
MAVYEALIETRTISTTGISQIVFSDIPQIYDDLKIFASIRTTPTAYREDGVGIRFNSDASTNYSSTTKQWSGGSGWGSFRQQNETTGQAGLGVTSSAANTANTFAANEIYIPEYRVSKNKQYLCQALNESNTTDILARFFAGLWRNTAAINAISISSAQYAVGTTFYLYGIKRS